MIIPKDLTQARVGLGRHGNALPTTQHLAMLEAQSLARDSLWRVWDPSGLEKFLVAEGIPNIRVRSEAANRQDYLLRPDWGRRLTAESEGALRAFGNSMDAEIVFCVSDGLATDAINRQLQPFLSVFLPALAREAFVRGRKFPFILAPLTRVAAQDVIGECLKARMTVMFVGERPGLSASDSMGIYMTYEPRRGLLDGRRNCISNVRPPHGLSYEEACGQLIYLMRESLRLHLSGVDLKPKGDEARELAPSTITCAETE